MFLLLPFVIWMFDTSVTSEVSYEQFTERLRGRRGGLPGWFWKLVAFALIWAYLLHFMRRPAPPLDGRDPRGRPRASAASRRSSRSASAPSSRWRSAPSSSSERPMSISFGSRRLVVGAHYGLRDWLAQRVTSLVMALFTVAVVVQVLMPGAARLLQVVGDLRARSG